MWTFKSRFRDGDPQIQRLLEPNRASNGHLYTRSDQWSQVWVELYIPTPSKHSPILSMALKVPMDVNVGCNQPSVDCSLFVLSCIPKDLISAVPPAATKSGRGGRCRHIDWWPPCNSHLADICACCSCRPQSSGYEEWCRMSKREHLSRFKKKKTQPVEEPSSIRHPVPIVICPQFRVQIWATKSRAETSDPRRRRRCSGSWRLLWLPSPQRWRDPVPWASRPGHRRTCREGSPWSRRCFGTQRASRPESPHLRCVLPSNKTKPVDIIIIIIIIIMFFFVNCSWLVPCPHAFFDSKNALDDASFSSSTACNGHQHQDRLKGVLNTNEAQQNALGHREDRQQHIVPQKVPSQCLKKTLIENGGQNGARDVPGTNGHMCLLVHNHPILRGNDSKPYPKQISETFSQHSVGFFSWCHENRWRRSERSAGCRLKGPLRLTPAPDCGSPAFHQRW